MRKFYVVALALLCIQTGFAQNASTLQSGLSLFKADKKLQAAPYFKQIFEGQDEQLKTKAIISLSETWLNTSLKRDSGSVLLGNMLIQAFRPLTQKNPRTAAESYTVGIAAFAVVNSGTLRSDLVTGYLQNTLGEFSAAAEQRYPKAAYFMARALMRYRPYDKSVPHAEIMQSAAQAMEESKDPEIMYRVMDQFIPSYTWGRKSPDMDTAKWVISMAMREVYRKLPDSLFAMVDFIWKKVGTAAGHNDTTVAFLNAVLEPSAKNPAVPDGVRKAIAWNWLYQYFADQSKLLIGFETRQRNRKLIMTKLKQLYQGREKQLLAVAGEFLVKGPGDVHVYASEMETLWLDEFSKQAVGNTAFYQGVIMTNDNYLPFLKMEPDPSKYEEAIFRAYQVKQQRLLSMEMNDGPDSKSLGENVLVAVTNDKLNLYELGLMPAFATSPRLRQLQINNELMHNLVFFGLYNSFTPDIDNTIVRVNALSDSDKAALDKGIIEEFHEVLSLMTAVSEAASKGIEIPMVDLTTRKVTTSKFYPKDDNIQKKKQMIKILEQLLDK